MSRLILPLVVLLLGLLTGGCATSGVGDPCQPGHPPLASGQPSCAPDAGCFNGGEIYIETRSLQCRTRVCMVYKWDEASNNDSASRAAHVFCTCRCGGEGDPASFCQCPDRFACATAFVAGEPGIRGSYCVRYEALPPNPDGGVPLTP